MKTQVKIDKTARSKKPFKPALIYLFETSGLSHKEVGERMNPPVKRQRIEQYISNGMVSFQTMERLADVFGVSPMYFVEFQADVFKRIVEKEPDVVSRLITLAEEHKKDDPSLYKFLAGVVQW